MDFASAQNNANAYGIQIPNTVVKDQEGALDFNYFRNRISY